jgi:hypothetical protein
MKGAARMPDSEAKKRWMRENSKIISFKVMNKSDADIIAYLKTVPVATTIKAALREYIQNHPET